MKKGRKHVKRDYSSMSSIEVYNLLRRGELKKFPNNYLDQSSIKEIVRHIFLVELKFTRQDIINKIDHCLLMELHMGGFRKFFDLKDDKLIRECFPEMDIKPWEFCKVEPKFWENKKNQKAFLLWVIEKEKIDPYSKEDLRRLTARTLINHGGSKLLRTEPDFYTILSLINYNNFKEWEIMKVRVWKEEKVISAVKWLVEERLKYTLEQACLLKVSDFKKYNLDGMLQKACNHSILYALNLAYGNCFIRDGNKGIAIITTNV